MSIARLPRKAALKFASLRDEVEEANNLKLSIQRRISETENQIRHMNPETDAEQIAVYEEEIRRQSDRRDAQQHRHLTLDRRLVAIQTWLNQLAPNVVLTDAPEPSNPGDGKLGEEGVDRCREDIHRLTERRKLVARAVQPLDTLLEQVDAHVDALAQRGSPSIIVAKDQLSIRHNFDGWGNSPTDSIVIMAWLHPDDMKHRLREEVQAMREKERHLPVMTPEVRKAKLKELDARILAVEREEEALICECAECNLTIERRENANPAAILCVVVGHRKAQVNAA